MIKFNKVVTRSMVITLNGQAQNAEHSETRVTYIDSEGDTWTENFNIDGNLNFGDILSQTRSVSRSTPTARAAPAFSGPWITRIEGGTTVTGIAVQGENEYAQALSRLTYVSFPNATIVGEGAFSGCFYLEDVNLPKVVTIGAGAFMDCSGLSAYQQIPNVGLKRLNLPSVTTIGENAFSGCLSLMILELGSMEYGSGEGILDNISYWGLSDACYVKFSDADVNAQYIDLDENGYIYVTQTPSENGILWEGGELVNSDAEGVSSGAFAGAMATRASSGSSSGSSYEFTKFQPTSVNLPNATYIGDGAFYSCNTLESVNLPAVTTIGTQAFSGCTSIHNLVLTSITRQTVMTNCKTWGLKGSMLLKCQGESTATQTDIDVVSRGEPRSDMVYDQGEGDGVIVGATQEWLGGPLVDSYALGVYDGAFSQGWEYPPAQPTSVSMPNVERLGADAFYGCDNLTSASFPRATYVGYYAFQDTGLATLDLSSISYNEWSQYWRIPAGCVVTFSDGIKQVIYENNMYSLISYTIPYYIVRDSNNCLDVTTNGSPQDTVYNDVLSENRGTISDSSALSIADNALNLDVKSGLDSPEQVVFPSVVTVGQNAFYGCQYLMYAVLPSATTIGSNAFTGCDSLRIVMLSSQLTVQQVEANYETWGIPGGVEIYLHEPSGENDSADYTTPAPATYLKYDSNSYLTSASASDQNKFEFQGGTMTDSTALGIAESTFDRGVVRGVYPTSVSMPNCEELEDYVFWDCINLTSASFPALTTIGHGAFAGTGLTTLVLSSISRSDVQTNAQQWGIPTGCVVTCSDGVLEIEPYSHLKYNEDNYLEMATPSDPDAFEFQGGSLTDSTARGVAANTFNSYASQVPEPTSVNLPEAVEIGDQAFYRCENLTTANLPKVTTIGNGAFQFSGLTSLTLTSFTVDVVNSMRQVPGEDYYIMKYAEWGVPYGCVVTCSDGTVTPQQNSAALVTRN